MPQFSGDATKDEGSSITTKGRPQYVTIQRNRQQVQEPDEDSSVVSSIN